MSLRLEEEPWILVNDSMIPRTMEPSKARKAAGHAHPSAAPAVTEDAIAAEDTLGSLFSWPSWAAFASSNAEQRAEDPEASFDADECPLWPSKGGDKDIAREGGVQVEEGRERTQVTWAQLVKRGV